MYRITERMFKEEIKPERYTVIAFEGDRRVSTHGGLHMLDAMKEIVKMQGINRTLLVVNQRHIEARQEDKSCIRWEKESFKDLFDLRADAFL